VRHGELIIVRIIATNKIPFIIRDILLTSQKFTETFEIHVFKYIILN